MQGSRARFTAVFNSRRLLLVAAFVIVGLFGVAYGFVAHEKRLPPYHSMRQLVTWSREQPILRKIYYSFRSNVTERDAEKGRWRKARLPADLEGLTQEQIEAMGDLAAVGYLAGSEEAPEESSVTRHDAAAYGGLNLYVSGHGPEAILMDMDGAILHRWHQSFAEAFPDSPQPEGLPNIQYWRRAHPFENGDLLAIFDGFGLIKIDKDSRLIWSNAEGFHHDLDLDEEGRIYSLTREVRVIPRIHPVEPVLEDFVVVTSPGGEVVRKVSLLEAFENSVYASLLDKMPSHGDIFHTNTIERFDGRHESRSPIFKKNNVLVSVRYLNAVAIVDLDQQMVVWALSGLWIQQHQPTLLDDGNLLVVDNRGYHGRSKVVELDPLTQEIVWMYAGDPPEAFFTPTCGAAQRLPNGNTLITESDPGRAFEVTPGKDIVWEFYNPHRAGENGEYIATLFEVVRLDLSFSPSWLGSPAGR